RDRAYCAVGIVAPVDDFLAVRRPADVPRNRPGTCGRVAEKDRTRLAGRDIDDEDARPVVDVLATREDARAVGRPMLPAVDPRQLRLPPAASPLERRAE